MDTSGAKRLLTGIGTFLKDNRGAIGLAVGLGLGAYATRHVDNKIEAARLKGREEAEEAEEDEE